MHAYERIMPARDACQREMRVNERCVSTRDACQREMHASESRLGVRLSEFSKIIFRQTSLSPTVHRTLALRRPRDREPQVSWLAHVQTQTSECNFCSVRTGTLH